MIYLINPTNVLMVVMDVFKIALLQAEEFIFSKNKCRLSELSTTCNVFLITNPLMVDYVIRAGFEPAK